MDELAKQIKDSKINIIKYRIELTNFGSNFFDIYSQK